MICRTAVFIFSTLIFFSYKLLLFYFFFSILFSFVHKIVTNSIAHVHVDSLLCFLWCWSINRHMVYSLYVLYLVYTIPVPQTEAWPLLTLDLIYVLSVTYGSLYVRKNWAEFKTRELDQTCSPFSGPNMLYKRFRNVSHSVAKHLSFFHPRKIVVYLRLV
jgi:hypothetical protein